MANRTLSKPIRPSNNDVYVSSKECEAEVMINASSQERGNRTHESCDGSAVKEEYARLMNEIDELHNRLLLESCSITRANGLLGDVPRGSQNIHCLSNIDSPTLVPCSTPVLSPAHSLHHIHAPVTKEKLFYQHESLAEQILMASCASDSSDEAEEPDDVLLSDRDCFRFDDSKAVLRMADPLAELPVEIPRRCPTPGPVGARKAVGLGLSELPKRNTAEPFDGLGLVSIHGSKRHELTGHHTTSIGGLDKSAYDSSGTSSTSTSNDSISSTMLNETLLSFTEDPLHVHALNAIPECRSWYEIGELMASSSSTGKMYISADPSTRARSATVSTASKYRIPYVYRQHTGNVTDRQDKDIQHGHTHCCRVGVPLGSSHTTKPNFLSATISSELKRTQGTSVKKSHTTASGGALRARSATWPSRNETQRDRIGKSSPEDYHKAPTVSPRSVPMWRV